MVAYSRIAAVRYYHALQAARDELLAEADALPASDKALDDEALCQRPPKVQAQVQAWRYRETLQALSLRRSSPARIMTRPNGRCGPMAPGTNS